MTGQQLEAKAWSQRFLGGQRVVKLSDALDALAAARADERERIAKAIEAEAQKVRAGQHLNTTSAQANHHGRVKGLEHAAALVRAVSDG